MIEEEVQKSTRTERTDLPLSYTLNGLTINFDSVTPTTNAVHNVGVVYSRMTRPAHGSEAEQKMIEAIGKNQYSKFTENESSLKDVLKLEESHGLDKNIRHLCTFLESYDLLALFTIVCPVDSKLRECTLKTLDSVAITDDLLTSYRTISQKLVAQSTAWYNKFGYFKDA